MTSGASLTRGGGVEGTRRRDARRAEVIARGPFSVGSVVWQDAQGRLLCTIVAKATYALAPGVNAPLADGLPLQEEDGHWDDDAEKSVHAPSDLSPFKKAPEVVVVGSAFAPGERPAPSVIARVVVGSVDKSVEAFGPRFFQHDGALEEGPRPRRFSLRYEHAAGGPDSDNPIGIDLARIDTRGRRVLPQLLPLATDLGPAATHAPTIGLGPITASWRPRSGSLTHIDRDFLADLSGSPMPQGFPTSYFQAAPMDQWLVRPLAANERIVLENLHQKHPRLVSTLSGLEPHAVVLGEKQESSRMRGDLLVVDSDRALCTLTFRAHFPIGAQQSRLRVVVIGLPLGTELSAEAIRALAASIEDEPSPEEELDLEDALEMTRDVASHEFFDGLPFAASPPSESKRAPNPDGALPFSGASPAAAPPPLSLKKTDTITTLTSLRQTSTHSLPSPPVEETMPFAPPPVAPARPALGAIVPPRGAPAPPGPMPPAMVPPTRAMATPAAPMPHVPHVLQPSKPILPGLRAREAREAREAPPNTSAAAFASDAAAREEKAREEKPDPARMGLALALAHVGPPPLRRSVVVDLFSFDAKIVPRVKSMVRFASIWAKPLEPRGPKSVDEPRRAPADPDRVDLLKALSCGTPQSASEIRAALAESLDDLGDLEPPLVFCAGELAPTFDEMEQLRATVAVAKSVAGMDKRQLASIAVAEEALAAPLPPAPETLRSLSRQIEAASTALALPPRFIAANVERILVEGRKHKRRPLLGAPRVRADLVLTGAEVFPFYLPDAIAGSLPLLPSFPIVAICEVRPREDLAETQAEALFCVALGRVLAAR